MGAGMEQRKSQRKQTVFYLEVVDAEIGQPTGRLVDLTAEGLMLIHEHPLAVNRLYQLQILLPKKLGGVSQVDCTAECRWCRPSINSEFFDAGLRIIEISEEDAARIDMIMKYYSFAGAV
ncbi:PilZ domain-containing protein [Trichloromonas sp.]|uniref:PilZ domain-containing protein n=1 Tax=Trichloromonas sp. TaxID=3069249 RepID=UPI002A3F1830|nr:PilZ domain-containing protein [Trichloromonas sp.]